MPKWKMIGIRVPEESDLPIKLKEISEKTRLSYYELLEKLITQAELDTNTLVPNFEAKNIITFQAQFEKLSDLRKQINEIETRLEVLEKTINHVEDVNSSHKSEVAVIVRQKGIQHTGKLHSIETNDPEPAEPVATTERPKRSTIQSDGPETSEAAEEENEKKAATIAYIRHLSAEGLSLRKIAERLNTEEVPTLSRSAVWNYGTVNKVLTSRPN